MASVSEAEPWWHLAAGDPPHWDGSKFYNPYRKGMLQWDRLPKLHESKDPLWPARADDHLIAHEAADLARLRNPVPTEPTLTWLGHATTLLQYQGVTVLTDPILSDYAGPARLVGTNRYTPAPLAVTELPRIDVVVISHNHYDHLDAATVDALGNSPHWFVPKGLAAWFADRKITNVTELDWWQSARIGDLTLLATPSQHWSNRTMIDRNKSLWASWAILWPDFRFWFAGDTGYNAIQFKQIGDRVGPFDLAAIPIGAYAPREIMENQHINPEEAVQIHRDIRSQYSFGIHWGTFVLTTEPVDEPPQRLAQARREQDVADTAFEALVLGRSYSIKRNEPK